MGSTLPNLSILLGMSWSICQKRKSPVPRVTATLPVPSLLPTFCVALARDISRVQVPSLKPRMLREETSPPGLPALLPAKAYVPHLGNRIMSIVPRERVRNKGDQQVKFLARRLGYRKLAKAFQLCS